MNVFHVFVLLLAFFTSTSSSFPTPLVNRDTRALAPSVESWCIFYPEKCRQMLRFAGTHKRYVLDDVEY